MDGGIFELPPKQKAKLPSNGVSLRKRVLVRDGYRCTALVSHGHRCTECATDVDRIRRGFDHSLLNLTSLCVPGTIGVRVLPKAEQLRHLE